MTDYVKRIKEKLDTVTIEKEDFNTLVKDRLDFGFDSIYFRYAEVCDELAAYKATVHGTDPTKERAYMNGRKQHFYETLEQLLMIHEKEDKNNE